MQHILQDNSLAGACVHCEKLPLKLSKYKRAGEAVNNICLSHSRQFPQQTERDTFDFPEFKSWMDCCAAGWWRGISRCRTYRIRDSFRCPTTTAISSVSRNSSQSWCSRTYIPSIISPPTSSSRGWWSKSILNFNKTFLVFLYFVSLLNVVVFNSFKS